MDERVQAPVSTSTEEQVKPYEQHQSLRTSHRVSRVPQRMNDFTEGGLSDRGIRPAELTEVKRTTGKQ